MQPNYRQTLMAKSPAETSEEGHPYAFHVSGPRNLSFPTWREIISSSWNDCNYKRTVIACFVQVAYLLEIDRQENKTKETGLAPKWWKPFKYKLAKILVDERDGSIFGAIIEWDRSAALSDFILMKPSGAPSAVLALRGTYLKSPSMRRDLEDDLRFLAWESLRGSVRFNVVLEALKSAVNRFGSCNVCIAGHSLGAGLALQVGKQLAKQGIFVEAHLFNPPSVSLANSVKNISEKAVFAWKRIRGMLPSNGEIQLNGEEKNAAESKVCPEIKKWVPNLYVNNSDYICCYYTDRAGTAEIAASSVDSSEKMKTEAQGQVPAKLFVASKGPQKCLEAHGLEQWWSDDMELQQAIHESKLVSRQLKSLYSLPPPSQGNKK